jgi:hypothetical protein
MSTSITYANQSAVGFGAESTYATSVARTVWAYPISVNLRPNMVRQDRDYTRSSNTDFNSREDYVAFRGWSGNITVEVTYDNIGLLLRQCLGTVTDSGPVGSIYTHVYKRALAFPVGLTIEVNRGIASKDLYNGGKVMRWTLSHDVSTGKPMTLSMDLIGAQHSRSDSPASVTARTNETLLHYNHAGGATTMDLNFNSVNYPWKRWSITGENGLAERRFNSSLYTTEPLRNSKSGVTLQFVTDNYDTLMDAYEAGTQANVFMLYDDPSSLKTFRFDAYNCKLVDYMDSEINGGSPGILEATSTFKTFTDGTNDALQITVENLTTTGIANG